VLICTHRSWLVSGSIAYAPKERQPNDCTWDSLFSDIPPVHPNGMDEGTHFRLDESVVSRSGDVCSEWSWVFYDMHNVCSNTDRPIVYTDSFSQLESPLNVACVYRIVTSEDAATSFIILEPWSVSSQRDEYYGMPALHCNYEDTYFAMSPKVCFFAVHLPETHNQ